MAEHSPTDVTHVLKGIHLPTDRQGLLEHAQRAGAPQDVLDEIENFDDGDFHTMADVMKAFGSKK